MFDGPCHFLVDQEAAAATDPNGPAPGPGDGAVTLRGDDDVTVAEQACCTVTLLE